MTLQIVQISDTHISANFPQRAQDLENCVQAINKLPEQPALVVHTGDVSHDGLSTEYHTAKQHLDTLRAPYVVIPGNRDNREELLHAFSGSIAELPKTGWVQYAVETFPVRLLMVDTVSTDSNKGRLCNERMAHLKAMLDTDKSKPVALFLHHPPYEATGIPDPYQYEDWDDVTKLDQLLSQYNNIKAMYCGHVHRFIDGNIARINASAITCLAGDLRKGEVKEEERALPVLKEITLL